MVDRERYLAFVEGLDTALAATVLNQFRTADGQVAKRLRELSR